MISNPVAAYLTFTAVKFIGYTIASKVIARVYVRARFNSFLGGAMRTVTGCVAGAAYFFAMMEIMKLLPARIHQTDKDVLIILILGLVPVRILEWWFYIWIFFDRKLKRRALGWKVVPLAVLWSFCCDIPAITGVVATGGICFC